MKKKHIFFIYLCFLGLINSLYGGGIEVSGEFLYLQTCVDYPYFANQTTSSIFSFPDPDGKRYHDHQKWRPGYRLKGDYRFCNGLAIEARWTHYIASSQRRFDLVAPTSNVPYSEWILTPDSFASLHSQLRFRDLDLILKGIVWDCECSKFWLRGGLKYGKLHNHQFIDYIGQTPNIIQIKSKMWGVGPQLGLEFESNLWRCLSFYSNLNASYLITKSESSFVGLDLNIVEFRAILNNEPLWRGVPTIDLQCGFAFSTPLKSLACQLELQAGYVMINYFRSLCNVVSVGDETQTLGNSIDMYYNVFLHGPYVRLSLYF